MFLAMNLIVQQCNLVQVLSLLDVHSLTICFTSVTQSYNEERIPVP